MSNITFFSLSILQKLLVMQGFGSLQWWSSFEGFIDSLQNITEHYRTQQEWACCVAIFGWDKVGGRLPVLFLELCFLCLVSCKLFSFLIGYFFLMYFPIMLLTSLLANGFNLAVIDQVTETSALACVKSWAINGCNRENLVILQIKKCADSDN